MLLVEMIDLDCVLVVMVLIEDELFKFIFNLDRCEFFLVGLKIVWKDSVIFRFNVSLFLVVVKNRGFYLLLIFWLLN